VRKSTTVGFLTVLAFGALIALIRLNEPCYNGRTLTGWLQQYSDASMDETQRLAEARSAVLAIGAQKALPRILKLAETQDDPVSTWMTAKTEEFRIPFFHWRSTIDSQLMGFDGFEILGTNAAPAVPELTRLLEDNNKEEWRFPTNMTKAINTGVCVFMQDRAPDAPTNSVWPNCIECQGMHAPSGRFLVAGRRHMHRAGDARPERNQNAETFGGKSGRRMEHV